jgi:hypothetical protein
MSSEERIGVIEAPTIITPQQSVTAAIPAPVGNVVPMPAQPPIVRAPFDYQPTTLDGALKMADILADSELVPKDYRNKPANVFVAMQWGNEIGLRPLQAVQNIAVINGRPSLWGDAMLALVRNSPLCEYIREEFDDAGTAICRVKRRGDVEQVRTFSAHDQQTAGLLNRDTHKTYPQRMRQMRARAWALRDVFADVLRGIPMAEEAMDMLPVVDAGPAALPPAPKVAVPKAKPKPPEDEEDRKAGKTLPPEPAAGEEEGATVPASPAMVTHVRKVLERCSLSGTDVHKRFPTIPESLEGLTVAQVNTILAWSKDPTQ